MVWFWHLSIVKFCIYPYVGSPDAPLGTELPKNTHVLAEGALGIRELGPYISNLCPSFLLIPLLSAIHNLAQQRLQSLILPLLKNNAKLLILFPKNSRFPVSLCAELQNP